MILNPIHYLCLKYKGSVKRTSPIASVTYSKCVEVGSGTGNCDRVTWNGIQYLRSCLVSFGNEPGNSGLLSMTSQQSHDHHDLVPIQVISACYLLYDCSQLILRSSCPMYQNEHGIQNKCIHEIGTTVVAAKCVMTTVSLLIFDIVAF